MELTAQCLHEFLTCKFFRSW